MGLAFGPEHFNATYFGCTKDNQLSNYRTPYNRRSLAKTILHSTGALLIAAEFWRKTGFNDLDILDLGGATGALTSPLNHLPGIRAFNMDLSSWATQNAVNSMKGRVIQGNIISLPFQDSCLDGLISLDVLEHLQEANIESTVGEMYRVLKPKRIGIIVVNTGEFEDFEKDRTHLTKRGIDWWKEKFKKAGFSIDPPIQFPGRNKLSHTAQIAWRFKALHPGLLVINKPE